MSHVTVDPRPDCAIPHGQLGPLCAVASSPIVPAYRWNANTGWAYSERSAGDRVYVYPFGSGWSWTWTQGTGWLAARSSSLVIAYQIQPSPLPTACSATNGCAV